MHAEILTADVPPGTKFLLIAYIPPDDPRASETIDINGFGIEPEEFKKYLDRAWMRLKTYIAGVKQ